MYLEVPLSNPDRDTGYPGCYSWFPSFPPDQGRKSTMPEPPALPPKSTINNALSVFFVSNSES